MADFNFTQISNSTAPDPTTFAPNIFANSSVNNQGYVDYEGFFGAPASHLPPSAIYSGNGKGPSTAVVNISKYSYPGYNAGIYFSSSSNNKGTTVFASAGYNLGTAQINAGGPTAILSSTNGSLNTVAYSSKPFSIGPRDPSLPLTDPTNQIAVGQFVTAPGINDNGTIAGIGSTSDGVESLYTTGSSGLTTIANTNGPLKDFLLGGLDVGRGEGPFGKYTLPAINNSGSVAFNADLDNGGKGIFVGNGGQLTTIAANNTSDGPYTYLSDPSLNNGGQVVFNAGFKVGGGGIFSSVNGQLTTLADTSNGFFKNFRSDVALNNSGQVAFLADYTDGTGIFTGSATTGFKEVISVGDSLAGSTVKQLFISHKGLNDKGQLSFDAVLGDGSIQNVFRADPTAVPEASSSVFFALAILGMIGYRWRRQMHSAKRIRL